ncbi:unnamed protein product [Citrullus colocynthis]|uniref:Uncharacterized protein n=1 Tax=Citrullus colocynthis TaxID=252529 RepID=A0ABP0YBG0_9ROSI
MIILYSSYLIKNGSSKNKIYILVFICYSAIGERFFRENTDPVLVIFVLMEVNSRVHAGTRLLFLVNRQNFESSQFVTVTGSLTSILGAIMTVTLPVVTVISGNTHLSVCNAAKSLDNIYTTKHAQLLLQLD